MPSWRPVLMTLVLPAVLLVGCGRDLPGSPIPAAGFAPPPDTLSATPTVTGLTSSPAIPTPRRLDGVDLCTVLTEADLAGLGGLSRPARPTPGVFPESCSFPLGGGAAEDTVLVAFYKPFGQVREQQPQGHEETTADHSTWVYCATADGYQTCTAAVAVREDRTLVVAVSRRDVSAAKVISLLQPLTTTALSRLPPA